MSKDVPCQFTAFIELLQYQTFARIYCTGKNHSAITRIMLIFLYVLCSYCYYKNLGEGLFALFCHVNPCHSSSVTADIRSTRMLLRMCC